MQGDTSLFLEHYGEVSRKISALKKEIAHAKERRDEELSGVYPPALGNIGRSKGKSDPTYKTAERVIAYHDEKIARLMEELFLLEREMDDIRGKFRDFRLTPTERKYIYLRYAKELKNAQIARVMSYSSRQIIRIANRIKGKLLFPQKF